MSSRRSTSSAISILSRSKCWGEDLNLHAFRHKVLNLACLPFHHPSTLSRTRIPLPADRQEFRHLPGVFIVTLLCRSCRTSNFGSVLISQIKQSLPAAPVIFFDRFFVGERIVIVQTIRRCAHEALHLVFLPCHPIHKRPTSAGTPFCVSVYQLIHSR